MVWIGQQLFQLPILLVSRQRPIATLAVSGASNQSLYHGCGISITSACFLGRVTSPLTSPNATSS
jgi:hypothetical protein